MQPTKEVVIDLTTQLQTKRELPELVKSYNQQTLNYKKESDTSRPIEKATGQNFTVEIENGVWYNSNLGTQTRWDQVVICHRGQEVYREKLQSIECSIHAGPPAYLEFVYRRGNIFNP